MESLKAQGLEPGGLYSNSDSIQRYIHSRVSDAKIQGPSLTASSKVLYLYFTFVNVINDIVFQFYFLFLVYRSTIIFVY